MTFHLYTSTNGMSLTMDHLYRTYLYNIPISIVTNNKIDAEENTDITLRRFEFDGVFHASLI